MKTKLRPLTATESVDIWQRYSGVNEIWRTSKEAITLGDAVEIYLAQRPEVDPRRAEACPAQS